MTTDSRKFPFQDLPAVAKEHVVRVMDGQERLTFSVLSKNANRMSIPLCQQAQLVTIHLCRWMKIRSNVTEFPIVHITLDNNFTPTEVYSECDYIDGVQQDYPSRKYLHRPEYSARDWIDHFLELVKCQDVRLTLVDPQSVWEASSILKVLQGLNIKMILLCEKSGNLGELILNHFPLIKEVNYKDCHSRDSLESMLSGEFEYFGIAPRINLAEILLMKSKVMDIEDYGDSINTLLKKWIAGWNLNFKAMILRHYHGSVDDIPNFLTGIDYRIVEDDLDLSLFTGEQPIYSVARWNEKAYQIQREETGQKANLNFGVFGRGILVKLIVQN